MKRIAFIIAMAIVAFFGVQNAYAVDPELVEMEKEINASLPMDMDEGLTWIKLHFTDTNVEVSFISAEFEDISPSDIDSEARNAFRESFLESFVAESNPMIELARQHNLGLNLKIYNSKKQLLLNEFFKLSDFK